jgi:hypothetical protein
MNLRFAKTIPQGEGGMIGADASQVSDARVASTQRSDDAEGTNRWRKRTTDCR